MCWPRALEGCGDDHARSRASLSQAGDFPVVVCLLLRDVVVDHARSSPATKRTIECVRILVDRTIEIRTKLVDPEARPVAQLCVPDVRTDAQVSRIVPLGSFVASASDWESRKIGCIRGGYQSSELPEVGTNEEPTSRRRRRLEPTEGRRRGRSPGGSCTSTAEHGDCTGHGDPTDATGDQSSTVRSPEGNSRPLPRQ